MLAAAAARAESLRRNRGRSRSGDRRRCSYQGALAIVTRARRRGRSRRSNAADAADVAWLPSTRSEGIRRKNRALVAGRAAPGIASGESATSRAAGADGARGHLRSQRRRRRRQARFEWEGRTFRVDPAEGASCRLLRVRERQGGTSLDDALAAALSPSRREDPRRLRPGRCPMCSRPSLRGGHSAIRKAARCRPATSRCVTISQMARRNAGSTQAWQIPDRGVRRGGWLASQRLAPRARSAARPFGAAAPR